MMLWFARKVVLAAYVFFTALAFVSVGAQATDTDKHPAASSAKAGVPIAVSSASAASASPPVSVSPTKISTTTIYHNDELSVYYQQLLILALDRTLQTDGPYELVENSHQGGIERDRAMLIAGEGIDVMWGSVTRERSEKLYVIPIDLLKGLNNYRLLLIRKNDQARFDQVKTLDDLHKLNVGTGLHWTDGRILKSNGFSTHTSFSMPGLFKMLAAGRFDFISRGAHEISNDLRIYPDLNLAVEQGLILKYSKPLQYSFFVNKDNQKLAERLERGLRIAQADGSFERLANQLQDLRDGEVFLKQANRHIIEINNDVND